jgi:very-short-patch-repair endonuclease
MIQVHPSVARLPGAAVTPEQRIAAAVLAAGGDVLASHRSSARLWGAARPDDDPVDVLSPSLTRGIALDGVVLHRTRDRDHLHPLRRYNVPCTNILRTLVDLGAVDPGGVIDLVGHVISTGLADLGAIEHALQVHARPGRTGVVALRHAIDEFSIDAKPADSILEPAMHRLISRYHLPAVTFHPVIEGWEVDFRVIGTPVVLECDGWAYHGLVRSNFERDRRRDTELIAAGWIVIRFTYRSIMTSPGRTAERIRKAIARWSDAPTPDAA